MTDPADFWRKRAARHGHTGWRDQVVYAYDQQERLRIVEQVLERGALGGSGGIALDFGCGTGDFSRLLLARGFQVYGYDPFVRPRIDHPRFTYLHERARLEAVPPADLVLSVTVLDHILDETQLDDTLAQVRRVMRPDGRLALLEYALDGTTPARDNGYQTFRTLDQWRAVLGRHAFRMVESGPVPHPIDSPSAGFLSYRRQLAVRVVRRLHLADRWLGGVLLRRLARRSLAAHPPRVPHAGASPMRLMVCAP